MEKNIERAIKNFAIKGGAAAFMQISAPLKRVYKHRRRGMGLLWHSFIYEMCVENAEMVTRAALLPNTSKRENML